MQFDRSIIRELFGAAGTTFTILVLLFSSVVLGRSLSDAATGVIGLDAIVGVIAFLLINAMPTIGIVTVFVACVSVITRAYRDSEMPIWFSAGAGLGRWYRPVLWFAVPCGALLLLFTLLITPWSHKNLNEYKARYEKRSDIQKVAPGEFRESGSAERVFFVEAAPAGAESVNNVFLRWPTGGFAKTHEREGLVLARKGRIEIDAKGERLLVLENGRRFEVEAGAPQFRAMTFERYTLRLLGSLDDEVQETSARMVPTVRLLTQATAESANRYSGELFWRLSVPLAAIVLALLAVPLSHANPRVGRSAGLIMALLVFFIYLNVIITGQNWIQNGRTQFAQTYLVIHGVALAAVAVVFWWRARHGFGIMHTLTRLRYRNQEQRS